MVVKRKKKYRISSSAFFFALADFGNQDVVEFARVRTLSRGKCRKRSVGSPERQSEMLHGNYSLLGGGENESAQRHTVLDNW